jgi:hypothetical protein
MGHAKIGTLVLAGLLALGCAGSPEDAHDAEPDAHAAAERDGLSPIEHSGFRQAWAKPGANLAAYPRVALAPATVTYQRPPKERRAYTVTTTSNFALDEQQMETFKRYLGEAFSEELARSEHFELVELVPQAQPDSPASPLLVIEPGILDLTVKVPTQRFIGRENTFTTSTAEMTLRLELRDASSRDVLARMEERQHARQAGHGPNDLYWSNGVSDSEALRRTFRRWARILRTQLDEMHQDGSRS